MPPWLAVLAWRQMSCLHCAQWRPSVPLLRHHMSAAAFAYQQQQAAARKAIRLGVKASIKVTGVRTGGRLHPGLAGERLLKQRP